MSQEWDYPPRCQWQPEIKVLPRRPRFERLVDINPPKRKTLWRWYVGQMHGRGSWLYKANITALYFTGAAFLFAAIALCASIATLIVGKFAQ